MSIYSKEFKEEAMLSDDELRTKNPFYTNNLSGDTFQMVSPLKISLTFI